MEKEKQIEEMVEIAYNAICIQIGGGDFVDPGDRHAAAEIVSEDLYKAGYGNVKEGVREAYKQARKETIMEIMETLRFGYELPIDDIMHEIAKEYGAEKAYKEE